MKFAYVVNNHLLGGDRFYCVERDPYNPLDLPPYTIRVKFTSGYNPSAHGDSRVLVDAEENIWDITKESSNWTRLLNPQQYWNNIGACEVLGANTEGVTSMNLMFGWCRALSSVCLFDTSDVIDGYGMFKECLSLSSVPKYDFGNLVEMSNMFEMCDSLKTIPLYDTHKVSSMNSTFYMAHGLESIPLLDTSNVERMGAMFQYCYALTGVPEFNTPKVTATDHMFYRCQSLSSVPYFDISNVGNIALMFYHCYSLTSVPLYDTSNVSVFWSTFDTCSSLKEIPLFDTTNVTNMKYTFYNCFNVQSGAEELYGQVSSKDITHSGTFIECGLNNETGLEELKHIDIDWGGMKTIVPPEYNPMVLRPGHIVAKYKPDTWPFKYAPSLDSRDSSAFDLLDGFLFDTDNRRRIHCTQIDQVNNIWDMFVDYYGIEWPYDGGHSGVLFPTWNGLFGIRSDEYSSDYHEGNMLEILGMNIENVTTASLRGSLVDGLDSTFAGCSALSSVDTPFFVGSGISSMPSTFANTKITAMPVFNTSGIKSMNNTFNNTPITAIPDFDVTNLTSGVYGFGGCTEVQSGISAFSEKLLAKGIDPTESTAGYFHAVGLYGVLARCGENTPASAELQNVPTQWGGSRS